MMQRTGFCARPMATPKVETVVKQEADKAAAATAAPATPKPAAAAASIKQEARKVVDTPVYQRCIGG
ncbi:unnamed protein product [Linum trigynum]|uniref:Uncharacterized protein n=1 Tax=Linum trigynum TaxID=586398 RepID=A0AAV2F4I2_9ROSI